MLKDSKGITIASLVVTIIILLIIASVATVSGTGAIDYIKFNNAKAQVKTMQFHVNSWYEQSKNNPEILNYGTIDLTSLDANKVSNTLNYDKTGEANVEDYRYFSSEYIKDTFDIDGISYDFFIDIEQRSVLLYGGITYQGETYYSAEQFGINNIEYAELEGTITFDTNVEYRNNNAYLMISNIVIPEGISKYEIKYKVGENSYWTTVTANMKQDNGTWEIPIISGRIHHVKIITASNNVYGSKDVETITISGFNKAISDGILQKSLNMKLEDVNGDQIIIPANFNVSEAITESGNVTVVSDVVTEGIVIQDSNANQYVWIPVLKKKKNREWGVNYSKVTSEDDWEGIEKALINKTDGYTKTYRKSTVDEWFGDADTTIYGYYEADDINKEELIYYTNGNMTKEEYDTLYQNMLKSVYKNGGFYIGRYEMGIIGVNNVTEAQNNTRTSADREYISDGSDTDGVNSSSNEAPTIEGMTLPVSIQNAVPYNYITQSQSQMLAQKLNQESNYIDTVTTSIMFGVQWDIVCVFIENFDKNNTEDTKSNWLTSTTIIKNWANVRAATFALDRGFYTIKYNNKPVEYVQPTYGIDTKSSTARWMCTTGAVDQHKSLNIYDFGGNIYEWCLERAKNTTTPSIVRGGCFYNNVNASYRNSAGSFYTNSTYTSRVSFFIN